MASGIRWTTEGFIEQCRAVHGDRYDYSLVEYTNNKTKVQIICRRHGLFEQLAQHHMRGRGCAKCVPADNSKKLRSNTQEFIKKATGIHGNKYNYSLVDYVTVDKKVILICVEHGQFPQTPSDHLAGYGCPKCGLEKNIKARTRRTEGFIELAQKVHPPGRYDYSLVDYKKAFEDIKIICPIHNVFLQKPVNHLQGAGCPKCGGTQKLTQEEFIERAKEIHGEGTYDYTKVNYINGATKVEILCYRHSSFFQAPQDHLQGHGCQHCYSSTGEERISNILTRWGIKFARQKKFNECKNKRLLPFDFYFQLGKCHVLLEFDGGQHSFPVEYFGGMGTFERLKQNDAIKTAFAEKHGFILIRIPYSQIDSLESTLRTQIENHTNQSIEAITQQQQRKTKATLFNPTRYKQAPLL